MDIQISQNNASEYIMETSKIRWRLHAQKSVLVILLLFAVGLILFATGLSKGYDTLASQYTYNKERHVTYVTHVQKNYHFAFGLGIAFILYALYLAYINLLTHRSQFYKSVNTTIRKHKMTSDNYVIRITDNTLMYQDFEITLEEKWTRFSKYRNYQNYLLLFRDELFINCFVIDKRYISTAGQVDLQNFVSKRFVEKKGLLSL